MKLSNSLLTIDDGALHARVGLRLDVTKTQFLIPEDSFRRRHVGFAKIRNSNLAHRRIGPLRLREHRRDDVDLEPAVDRRAGLRRLADDGARRVRVGTTSDVSKREVRLLQRTSRRVEVQADQIRHGAADCL